MNKKETRPVWAEINLNHLAHNIGEVRRVIQPKTKICAVIKADGYGHGAVRIAQTLLDHGANYLAVATLSEAIQLRRTFLQTPILVLGYTGEEMAQQVIDHHLIQTLWDIDQARGFSQLAQEAGVVLKVHLKIDTGMGRVGFRADQEGVSGIAGILGCFDLPGLEIEGVYTHFACADEVDKTSTHHQMARYTAVVKAIESAGYTIAIKHVSNSAAIIDLPEYNLDMVRAGIMLYGLYPSPDVKRDRVKLKEVMALKARISHVKRLQSGEGISYGHIYKTGADEVIATLPLGYADGYTRLLTQKAQVLIGGLRVDVVGKICMDQCMIKLDPSIGAKRGDVVTLFGGDASGDTSVFLSIDEVANKLGTINYEIVCMMNKRIPRHYMLNNELIQVYDGVLASQ